MKGYHVERRFGWDTHGLPIEHEIDKKLGISGKTAVIKYGIDRYNEECRSIVMRYAREWRGTIERLGRWVDFDNDYKVGCPGLLLYVHTVSFLRGMRADLLAFTQSEDNGSEIYGVALVDFQATV